MNRKKEKIVRAINSYKEESVGVNRWKNSGNKKVCDMVASFDDDLVEIAKAISDERSDAIVLEYFAYMALLMSATTRDFEVLTEKEVKAFELIMDDIKCMVVKYVKNGYGANMYNEMHSVCQILKLNAIYREDFDCRYRCSMLISSYEDMSEIIHYITEKWEIFGNSTNFFYKFNEFISKWKDTIRTGGDENCDGGRRAEALLKILKNCTKSVSESA